MTEPRLIWLETHKDERGRLTTIAPGDGAIVPFCVKRVFYVYGVPLDAVHSTRGGHALKTCHQFLIAVAGMVLVKFSKEVEYYLEDPGYGLYIPPGFTSRQTFLTPNACLLVLASEPYDKDGYIYEERK